MVELKQMEVDSLEKQIVLLREVSADAQHTQSTVKSLQDQIAKLQTQLAVSCTFSNTNPVLPYHCKWHETVY